MALMGLVVSALVACGNSDGGQAPSGEAEASYEGYEDADAMLEAAHLVIEVDGLPTKTERVVSSPAHRVIVSEDGREQQEFNEVAVYEVVVAKVLKGEATAGDRILVAPSVDGQMSPPASQAGLLETTVDATLYLNCADTGCSGAGISTTLTPYAGVVG